jgi:threonine dehydrogenase-like Zn-dependent dehydrogenase
VVVEGFIGCGECAYCRTGQYNICPKRMWVSTGHHGGFAKYTIAHASGVVALPVSMSYEEGAMVEPLAVAVRALERSRATHQDRVAVIGGGTIGLLCLAVAKANGVKETLITVKYPRQAQLARELGADHVININDSDLTTAVKELTHDLGMDVVIETIGSAAQFNDAISIVRRQGTVVLLGGYAKQLEEVSLKELVSSEITVTGVFCYSYSGIHRDFQTAIDLISTRKVDATKLVTHRFPLPEIAEAFAVAADKQSGAIKVHISP